MNGKLASAEIFVMAFKNLKSRERAAVLERLLKDKEISGDSADTLLLESRRHQLRHSFRQVLKKMHQD